MLKECLVEELEDVFSEIYDEGIEPDYYEVETDDFENAMITVEGVRVIVPELKIYMRKGEVCTYDEDEETYMPDFSVSIIYDSEETDPNKYLYWEQDGYQVTLFNFFSKEGKSLDELGQMKCLIELDES